MWKHIGKPISTADAMAAVPVIYQGFKLNDGYRNQLLRGVVVGLLFYNLPTFADVKLEIWSDSNGAPKRLLAVSETSYSQSECNTDLFAYRIMGFRIPYFAVKKNTQYWLTVRPSTYTGIAASHIAWRQSWPDPQYPSGVTLTLEKGKQFPFSASFITADL